MLAAMTSREQLQTVLAGEIPDCVPVMPDTSNMIPARLTGKPFWDLYLYNDPSIWEAYIDCVKHFDIDSLMDGYFPLRFPEELAVMLRGSADDVVAASKAAIDDDAAGGRFILSTGDQCGRDTPDENLHAMIETARTYGQY